MARLKMGMVGGGLDASKSSSSRLPRTASAGSLSSPRRWTATQPMPSGQLCEITWADNGPRNTNHEWLRPRYALNLPGYAS